MSKNFSEPLFLDLLLIKRRIRSGQRFSLCHLTFQKLSMQERSGHSVLTLSVMLEINHLAAAVGLLDLQKHLMIGTVSQQVRAIFCHLLSVRGSHACYQIRFEISFLCFSDRKRQNKNSISPHLSNLCRSFRDDLPD